MAFRAFAHVTSLEEIVRHDDGVACPCSFEGISDGCSRPKADVVHEAGLAQQPQPAGAYCAEAGQEVLKRCKRGAHCEVRAISTERSR